MKWFADTANSVSLALALAPTLGHLVIARELSKIGRALDGKEETSTIDWMRTHWPNTFADNVKGLLKAGSRPTEAALGLSLENLLEVEKHFYQILAPVSESDGSRRVPDFIKELAEAPFRPPGTPYSAFVFLGKGREDEAMDIQNRWNQGDRPPTNPYPKDDQRHLAWAVLEELAQKGKLPIFLDLDGDNNTYTATEFVAKRTLASMTERNNHFGDGFQDPGLYYAWLSTRIESNYHSLTPWVKSQSPKLIQGLNKLKTSLTPPWLGGQQGLGPFPSPERIDEAYQAFQELSERANSGDEVPAWCSFADAVSLLDRDLVAGVQTHWIKFLREIGKQRRSQALPNLWRGFAELNLAPPSDPDYNKISPPNAPLLRELKSPPLRIEQQPYDRALSLAEVVDHTLDGLGLTERREALTLIRDEVAQRALLLRGREGELRQTLGDAYSGLDIDAALRGELDPATAKQSLDQLKSLLESGSLNRPQALLASRHWSLMDWLVHAEVRFGDVDIGLLADSDTFGEHPLAVCEYYEPLSPPEKGVTPLAPLSRPAARPKLAPGDDAHEMRLSEVFEGGGGKGFAFVECMKQLHGQLDQATGLFRIDEFVGTSAGAQVAALRAAGFEVEDMPGVMARVDFKEFNSDAIWLMGGVDPKVRGIDRTGLFSMQKMYQELHQILAEKLDIHGRPILFRDLPKDLKLVSVVLNTDLPQDDPLRDLIEEDGRFVMSSETTPNFDVVGAVLASSAVPAYFQAPQLEVARQHTNPDGSHYLARYHLQMADGGLVDNMSFSSAKRDSERRALVVIPAHTEGINPDTGELVALDTLNFNNDNLKFVDAQNRKLYGTFAPQMSDMLTRAEDSGVDRTVIAYDLAHIDEIDRPTIQGSNILESDRLYALADASSMPVLERDAAETRLRKKLNANSTARQAIGRLFDLYLDSPDGEDNALEKRGNGTFYHPGVHEEQNVFEVGRAAGAAALASSEEEYAKRRFEQPQ